MTIGTFSPTRAIAAKMVLAAMCEWITSGAQLRIAARNAAEDPITFFGRAKFLTVSIWTP